MIYYFSGTGNSAWIAKELGRQLNEDVYNIVEIMRTDQKISVAPGQNCGIVFPVYAWAPPLIVEKFVKKITLEPGAFGYAVCSCGGDAGNAIARLGKFLPLNAGWSLVMPSNYILGYEVDPQDAARDKVERARVKLIEIAANIHIKANVFDIQKGSLPYLKSLIGIWLFRNFALTTKPFYAEETCNGCGICEKSCPYTNIQIIEGRPVWGNNCSQCLSCINRCPNQAIQYGKKTQTRGRYYFPEDWA